MIHIPSLSDFTVSPWTKAPAAHEMFFKVDKLRYNAVPLLNFLADTLFSLGKPFVYRSQFTLLNVTSGLSALSYGVGRQPPKKLRLMNGLHFTFSFTTNWQYSQLLVPKHRFPVGPDTIFWGYDLRTSSNFMTIEVPRTVLREMGITTFNVREMMWVYHLVGAFTKNFLYHNSFYTEFGKQYNIEYVAPSVLYSTLPALFKRYNYAEWIYSYHAWRSMSNVLDPRCVSDQFCLHYLKHLTEFYRRFTSKNVLDIEWKIVDLLKTMVANKDSRLEEIRPRTESLDDDYVNALLGVK